MEHYYAARAGEYDRIYLKPERQADLRAIEAWLPDVFAGHRLLEIACGTGYWTAFLAPVCTSITAIDLADETLQIARARPQNRAVDFRLGDAYALPDELDRYPSAFAGFWISHVPRSRLPAFFAGLHRHLEPGATVVLLDNLYVPGSSTPLTRSDEEGNTWQTRQLADGRAFEVLKNFPDRAQLRAALPDPVEDDEWREWSYYWAYRYRLGTSARPPDR